MSQSLNQKICVTFIKGWWQGWKREEKEEEEGWWDGGGGTWWEHAGLVVQIFRFHWNFDRGNKPSFDWLYNVNKLQSMMRQYYMKVLSCVSFLYVLLTDCLWNFFKLFLSNSSPGFLWDFQSFSLDIDCFFTYLESSSSTWPFSEKLLFLYFVSMTYINIKRPRVDRGMNKCFEPKSRFPKSY